MPHTRTPQPRDPHRPAAARHTRPGHHRPGHPRNAGTHRRAIALTVGVLAASSVFATGSPPSPVHGKTASSPRKLGCTIRVRIEDAGASAAADIALAADLPVVLRELSAATGIVFNDQATDTITIAWATEPRRDPSSAAANYPSDQARYGFAVLKERRIFLNSDHLARPDRISPDGTLHYGVELRTWRDGIGARVTTPTNLKPGEPDGTMVGLRMLLRHELGHLLGLDHVTNPQSVMYTPVPQYRGGPGLPQVDRDALQALHAECGHRE